MISLILLILDFILTVKTYSALYTAKTITNSQITKFPPTNNRIADIQTNNQIYVLINK